MHADALQFIYLEWVNDYLTIEKFSEDYNLKPAEAESLIKVCKSLHERRVAEKYIQDHFIFVNVPAHA